MIVPAQCSPLVRSSSRPFRGLVLFVLVAAMLAGSVNTDAATADTRSSPWQLVSDAEWIAVPLLKASVSSRPISVELLKGSELQMTKLLSKATQEGAWWRPGAWTSGDPNVNRFTLLPLLEAALVLKPYIKNSPDWDQMVSQLRRCVEFQRRSYAGAINWDWGAGARGKYPNQDAYYALILALASELFEEPAWRTEGDRVVDGLEANVLPEGGLHYIGLETEAPVYHAMVEAFIFRYLQVTSYAGAARILARTTHYWSYVLSDQGIAESWSTPWMKQNWRPIPAESIALASKFSGDQRLADIYRRMRDRKLDGARLVTTYAAPALNALSLPATISGAHSGRREDLIMDNDIRGVRFRAGDWYYGIMQGRGFRSNFSGGMISKDGTTPLNAAFRGAQIQVITKSRKDFGYWLSSADDITTLTVAGNAAAVAARYTLQPTTLNSVPKPTGINTPLQVTQLWYGGPEGLIGGIKLEVTDDADVDSIVGRILLGPNAVINKGDGLWQAGDLQVRLFSCFDNTQIQNLGADLPIKQVDWPGIRLMKRVNRAKKGDLFAYAVWMAPLGSKAPEYIDLRGNALTAVWPSRRISLLIDGNKVSIQHEQFSNDSANGKIRCPL